MRSRMRIGVITTREGEGVAGRVASRVYVAESVEEARRALREALEWDVDILIVDSVFFSQLRGEVYRIRRERHFPLIVEGGF